MDVQGVRILCEKELLKDEEAMAMTLTHGDDSNPWR